MIRLCLAGGLGRMGRVIASVVSDHDDVEIVSVFETLEAIDVVDDYGTAVGYSRNPVTLTDSADEAVAGADAVVDFSLPSAFDAVVSACARASRPNHG